jgi:hypothetical protein
MYLVATVALVTTLMALLILGFLRVAGELLSRSIYETPSCQDEHNFERVERESHYWMPGMAEYSGEPNTCSQNPEALEDEAENRGRVRRTRRSGKELVIHPPRYHSRQA